MARQAPRSTRQLNGEEIRPGGDLPVLTYQVREFANIALTELASLVSGLSGVPCIQIYDTIHTDW